MEVLNLWPKRITVDRRIVNVLSQSTYDNFPNALKELVSNSYDADAKNVRISVDIKNEIIVIEDDGNGMSETDFEFYLRIAGQNRTKQDNTTSSGRNIIGQFGVGFLSVFPFFKNYRIETKKIGTSIFLNASIPLYKYFINQNKIVDIDSIEIQGSIQHVSNNLNGFTKITLQGFNDLTNAFFQPKVHPDKKLVETYSGIDKLKWILSDDLPLIFIDDRFNNIFQIESNPFNVFVNDTQLNRIVYGDEILDTHKNEYHQIGKIKFRYCVVTPRKAVVPYAARFLKIRNLNIGVGNREHFGVGHGASRSRFHWLTGEVHFIEGMNDLIKVSRDGFNHSNDFEEVKSYLNERLNNCSNKLEKESEIKREIAQTGTEFRVSNVSLLQKDALPEKIKKLENDGFEIKIASAEVSDFEKHIVIGNNRYSVSAESWDYEQDIFSACKVEKDHITLNTSYPLFQGKKYTDVFVKMNLMLLMNYKNGKMDKELYQSLTNEILLYFTDYK